MTGIEPTPAALAILAEKIRHRLSRVGKSGLGLYDGCGQIHYETITKPVATTPPDWLRVGALITIHNYSPCTVEAISDTICLVSGNRISWPVDTSVLARDWRPVAGARPDHER